MPNSSIDVQENIVIDDAGILTMQEIMDGFDIIRNYPYIEDWESVEEYENEL
jgi:hypothetical protein